MRGSRVVTVAAVLVVLLVAGIAVALIGFRDHLPARIGRACEVRTDAGTVYLNTSQMANAATIAAVGIRRKLPERAVTVALATALQESKLENLDDGDRDSIGLFQQRPSQGWGTREQILDPVYAINAFYDALVEIDGYQGMRITEAAQEVQRSGFPEAYEDHADDARALASALTGNSQDGQFTCVVRHTAGDESDDVDKAGLTARAAGVRAELEAVFGELSLGGFDANGVSTGHMAGSAHYDGRALDVFVRPSGPENRKRGWAMAYYLVAQAERLGVDHVIFDDMIWTSGRRSEEGWRDYDPGPLRGKSRSTTKILEHRDHVHVDVLD